MSDLFETVIISKETIEEAKKKHPNVQPIRPDITQPSSPFAIIPDVTSYPDLRYGKKVLNTSNNLAFLLNKFNISVRWNSMKHIREIVIPKIPLFENDKENYALQAITILAELNFMPTQKIESLLNFLAQNDSFHPILECIKSKPWDGTERLDTFIKTIKSPNEFLSYQLIYRWMLSAVAAISTPNGFSAQGVLVLQGKQNIGKTRWIKSLDPINCGAIKEGMILDPSNKDHIITCLSHWIIELGELDGTFRKSHIAALKSHITNNMDIIRFPYAVKNSMIPRKSVYAATVNESNFLQDDTGNRRWWTVEVDSIEMNHGLDIQQIWAEVYAIYLSNGQTWLNENELSLLTTTNIEHEQINPLEEALLSYFDWCENWNLCNTQLFTCTEVMNLLGYSNPSRAQVTCISNLIMKYTKKKPVRRQHILPRKKF